MAVRRPSKKLEVKTVVLKDLHHKINRKAMFSNIANNAYSAYEQYGDEREYASYEKYERAFEETLHAHYGDELDYYIM